jgi:hypothetical protein
MKRFRTSALLVVAILSLAACKRGEEASATAPATNPLLAHVPADTPYLFANLEPTPPEVVDAYLERFAPSLELAQAMLDDIQIEINSDDPEHRQARLMAAILNELDGKLDRQGFESLGFSLESHKAIYGIGAFPTMRLALRDADALRAAIRRIEQNSGMTFPAASAAGIDYWRFTDGGGQAGLYVAILDDHVAVGMFPAAAEAELLPALLGQALPGESMDSGEALAMLNRDQGYTRYGSGYIDFTKLADEFLDGNSTTLSRLGDLHGFDPASLDPACVAEIRGLVAQVPRLTAGTTELTANTVAVKSQLQLEPGLSDQLANLVADVATADDAEEAMFTAAVGIRVGRLKELLINKASAISAEPFQCSHLAGLNRYASQLLAQLNRPVPPFVGNLNGFRLRLDEIDLANPSPETARGMFSLEVEKPQMLVGMAQMFVPGVDELALEPGSDPVELPQELMSVAVEGLRMYAAMSKDAIGIALGADQQAGLADFMEASGDGTGTFFSISYDMAAHMEFQSQMRDRFLGADGEAPPDDTEADEFDERLKAIEATYRDMLGRARLDMRFNSSGMEVENRMTFK